MKIICSGICDKGLIREKNQDFIYINLCDKQDMGLFVIADGIGGCANGEIASKIVTNRLKEWSENFEEVIFDYDFRKMMQNLEKKIIEINLEIYNMFNQSQICGSTCVLLFIYRKNYGIIHVGDSRIYVKDKWKLKSLMKDNVWENKIDVRESMSLKEIVTHANYGKLLEAVGIKENILFSTRTDQLKKGDTFLMCSDGLYKYCPKRYMVQNIMIISESNINEAVKKLLKKCYSVGAKDNISIIIVKCI